MWIRSQDKKRLINVPAVFANWNTPTQICCNMDDESPYYWLGNYKSTERAVEVIDEIQGHNERIEIAKLGGINCFETPLTYQMPKE